MPMAFRGIPSLDPNFAAQRQIPDAMASLTLGPLAAPQQQVDPSLGYQVNPRIKPTAWQEGGKGWDTVGKVGDALALMGGRQPIYYQQQQEQAQQALANQFKQQQLMIEAWKARQGNRTPFQNNYEYLQGLGRPKDAEAFLANTVDPVTLTTDPTTGMLTSLHKSGAPVARPAAAIPEGTRMTINGKDAWYVNGDWYDNPEGR